MSFKEIPIQKPELQKLYRELGEARVRSIVLDFYARMEKDVMIGFFFTGRDIPSIAAKQTEFLLRAMGATPSYAGKAPADAHTALPPILTGHFDRRLKILEEALSAAGLTHEQVLVWIGFENAFRNAIVSG